MTNGYRSDNEQLAERAGRFKDLADRADRIAGDLSGALDALGECWGSDATGRSFAARHVEPSTSALRRIGALHGQIGGVGTRLAETAATYQRAEQEGLAALRSVDKDH